MKQKNDWTDAVRDRMKGAQVAPPAGGWERLEQQEQNQVYLGYAESRQRKSKAQRLEKELGGTVAPSPRAVPWKRVAAWVAAAAAVLAVVFIVNPSDTPPSAPADESLAAHKQVSTEIQESSDSPQSVAVSDFSESSDYSFGQTNNPPLLAANDKSPSHRSRITKALEQKEEQTTESSELSENLDYSDYSDISTTAKEAEAPAASENSAAHDNAIANAKANVANATHAADAPSSWIASATPIRTMSKQHRSLTFGIPGGGSSGGNTSYFPVAPRFSNNSYYYSNRPAAAPTYYSYSNPYNNLYNNMGSYVFNHKPELSLGFTVAYEPIERLIIESGMTWSILTSQVVTPTSTRTQRIQYLGVPLYVGWRFIEYGAFSLTASAGATVERCLSAQLGTWKQDERPWQYAVGSKLGVHYDLGHHFGLAFEPSVNYHLTETRLTTSRTDHPLALSLRLALQYTL